MAAVLLAAASPAFLIDEAPFVQADVLDARALPALDGGATLLVTLTPSSARRLPTGGDRSEHVLSVDGRSYRLEGGGDGVLQATLTISLTEAAALARRLSGRDPLASDLDE